MIRGEWEAMMAAASASATGTATAAAPNNANPITAQTLRQRVALTRLPSHHTAPPSSIRVFDGTDFWRACVARGDVAPAHPYHAAVPVVARDTDSRFFLD
jgi:hypothetical protein